MPRTVATARTAAGTRTIAGERLLYASGNSKRFSYGSGYIDTGFSKTYGTTDPFTIEFFIKLQKPTTNATPIGVIKEAGANDPALFLQFNSSNQMQQFIRDDGGVVSEAANFAVTFFDSLWHHLAWVRNTSTDKFDIFVDGVRIRTASDNSTSSISLSGGNFYLSSLNNRGTSGQSLTCAIDELRISNIARYTANFTSPSKNNPFTSDGNTDLLLNLEESGTPVDSGPNQYTLSVSGTVTNVEGYFGDGSIVRTLV